MLQLGQIVNTPGASCEFDLSFDFSQTEFGNRYPATQPVVFRGRVDNTAEVLILTAEISTVLHCQCDRCCSEYDREFFVPVDAILVTELTGDDYSDNVFLLQDDCADMDEIVTAYFVLNMETKNLCSDDCAGVCERCGKDLNEGPCDCGKEIDPRLAALEQLLQG